MGERPAGSGAVGLGVVGDSVAEDGAERLCGVAVGGGALGDVGRDVVCDELPVHAVDACELLAFGRLVLEQRVVLVARRLHVALQAAPEASGRLLLHACVVLRPATPARAPSPAPCQ